MNRDEILAKSRNDNRLEDEMVKQAKLKAASVSKWIGFLLCCLGAIISEMSAQSSAIGRACWMVFSGMHAAEDWVLVAKLKTKWGWIGAVIYTVLFLGFSYLYIRKVIAV